MEQARELDASFNRTPDLDHGFDLEWRPNQARIVVHRLNSENQPTVARVSVFGAPGAGSVEIDLVSHVGVAVLFGELACDVFNFAGGEPHRAAAQSAQQVVAVPGCATQPVERFTVFGALGFGDFHVFKRAQDPVDGRQPDPAALALTEVEMELLGTTEAVAAMQQVEHRSLLGGHSIPA
jgi:hypothetical protein